LKQLLKNNILFLGMVVVPMSIAISYYTFISENRYISETLVTVKSMDNSIGAMMPGLGMLVGAAPASRESTLYLREYIHSLDMLKILDQKLAMRRLYEAQTKDPLYRLYGWMDQEWYLWYYRNRVEVTYDDMTGLLRIRVEAFTPIQSRSINETILNESERFVNELSHKMSREQMTFAEEEFKRTKERYSKAKNALLSFQNVQGIFDPLTQAQAKESISAEMEATITKKEAELGAMLSYLQDSAPQVSTLRAEIAALKTQTKKEKARIASVDGGMKLNAIAANYQDLLIEAGFAEDAYKIELASVEKTRIDVNQKVKQLVVIQSPIQPESSEYPNRIYNLITLLVSLMLFYGIVKLVKATIEDHKY